MEVAVHFKLRVFVNTSLSGYIPTCAFLTIAFQGLFVVIQQLSCVNEI